MPANCITFVLTTGLGVSVMAGILSGVCYVLNYSRKNLRNKQITISECAVCSTQFNLGNTVLELNKSISCIICKLKVCKHKCSFYQDRYGWICQNCNSTSWLNTIFKKVNNVRFINLGHKMNQSEEKESTKKDDDLKNFEEEKIKEFVESLVTTLLGGEFGNTEGLYNNNQSNLPLSGQSSSIHENLKLLIKKFICESLELPNSHNRHKTKYEDVSSDIINKVIQNYHNGSSTYAPSISSESSYSKNDTNKREHFFGNKKLNSKKFQYETSSTSSSLEDWIYSEHNVRTPRNSLKVQPRIIEKNSSDDEESADNTIIDSEWEENWILQKRKFNGAHSPVPVPMLVPHPINELKVLIGDKEVDDTSDLSDAATDYEDYEYDAVPASLNSVLINSKTVIGGKNPVENITVWDNNLDKINEPKEEPFQSYEDERDVNETVNKTMLSENGNTLDIDGESMLSYESNTEQDLEYTERYPTLPKKVLKTPQPLPRFLNKTSGSVNQDSLKSKNIDSGFTSDEDEKLGNNRKSQYLGSYSEREKRKWDNGIEIANNPYSKSNLERRLSSRSSSSSISSLYSRDYYIKEATKPASSETYPTSSEEVDSQQNHVHSLTARSIPIKVKDFLRNHLSQDDTKKSSEPATEDFSTFPNTRSKIEFFENLRKSY